MFESVSLATLPLVFLIVVAGSAGQATIGMGLNLFAIPLLVLIDPIFAPGPMLLASTFLCLFAMWRVPVKIDRRELSLSLAGLAAGTIMAAGIMAVIDTHHLIKLLGVLVLIGVGLVLSGLSAPLTSATLVASGGAAGIMGTIAGVHAPPIALLYQGLGPERVRGALLSFIGAGGALSIVALWLVDRFGLREAGATLILLPGVAIGVLLAPALARLLDARHIRIAILVVSGVSGIALLLR